MGERTHSICVNLYNSGLFCLIIMVKIAALFSLAAADDLAWSDCGDASTHAHITDLTPLTIPSGETTHIKGVGALDADQEGGNFKFTAKAAGITFLKGSGNLCEDTTFQFPLNAGTMVVKGNNCPITAGRFEVDIDLSILTSGLVSNDLVKISVTGVNTAGEDMFCLALTTAGLFSEKASCMGTDDFPSTPACYGVNILGEDVVLKIEDFSAGEGHLNFVGTGATPLSCETAFTKEDSIAIAFENCDIFGAWVKIKGAQYCSDTDELKATFSPLGTPIPVSAKFPKIECPSSVTV